MKKIIFGLIFLSSFISPMEPPVPRDVASVIARFVCATAIEYKQLDKNALVRDGMRLSKNWNTLRVTHENLFDHQLWACATRRPQLRFDNDSIGDCNEFWTTHNQRLIVNETSPCFDGPNHDGGQHRGVIAVAHSTSGTFLAGDTTTQFNLFALNGIPVSQYQGPEKKEEQGAITHLQSCTRTLGIPRLHLPEKNATRLHFQRKICSRLLQYNCAMGRESEHLIKSSRCYACSDMTE